MRLGGMPDETGPISVEVEGEVLPLPGLGGPAGMSGLAGLPRPTRSSFGRADRKLLGIYRDFRRWLAHAQRTGHLARVVGSPGFNNRRAMQRRELDKEHARVLARLEALEAVGGDPAEIANLQARLEWISMEQTSLANVTTWFYFPAASPPRKMVGFGLAALAFQFLGVVLALGLSFLLRQRGDELGWGSQTTVTDLLGHVPVSVYAFWSLIGLYCMITGIKHRRHYFRSIHSSLTDNAVFSAYTRSTDQPLEGVGRQRHSGRR